MGMGAAVDFHCSSMTTYIPLYKCRGPDPQKCCGKYDASLVCHGVFARTSYSPCNMWFTFQVMRILLILFAFKNDQKRLAIGTKSHGVTVSKQAGMSFLLTKLGPDSEQTPSRRHWRCMEIATPPRSQDVGWPWELGRHPGLYIYIVMKVWNNFEKIHRIYDRIDRIDLCSFLVCENHTVKIKSQIQYLRLYGDMMVEACTGARTADHFFHPGFQEFGIRVVPWRSPLGTYPCHSKLLQTNLAHGEPWQQWSKVCINNKGVLTSAYQPEDTSYFRKTPREQPRSKAGTTHPTVYRTAVYIYTCHGLIQTFPVADRHRICMCPTDMVSQLV
jgi:hypothetical protein